MTIKELYELAVKEGIENEQIIIDDDEWGCHYVDELWKAVNTDGTLAGISLEWKNTPELYTYGYKWIEIEIK